MFQPMCVFKEPAAWRHSFLQHGCDLRPLSPSHPLPYFHFLLFSVTVLIKITSMFCIPILILATWETNKNTKYFAGVFGSRILSFDVPIKKALAGWLSCYRWKEHLLSVFDIRDLLLFSSSFKQELHSCNILLRLFLDYVLGKLLDSWDVLVKKESGPFKVYYMHIYHMYMYVSAYA